MSSQDRGVSRPNLDRLDWVEEAAARERDARRERHTSVGAPSRGRQGERRAAAERRDPPAGRPPRRAAVSGTSPRRSTAALPVPGVTERRALILVTFLLLLYGLVMAYSASAAEAYFEHQSSFYFVQRQAMWALLGVAAMWFLSRVDYGWYRRAALPLAVVVLFALILVLVPGVGSSINGARRWIIIGGQSITPSEFAKLAAVIVVAALVARRPREIDTPKGFLRLVAIGIVPAGSLIMLEPDLGTTLVLIVAVVGVLIAAGAKLRYLFLLFAAGCASVLGLILVEPYRLDRLVTFFDPWKDPQGSGFQATQSLISIASGRVFGVGLGNSVQKFGFLPEQGTDMITGIIGEELGLIGLVLLLALYVALAWACFRIALSCRELFAKLLATGITAIIIGQACINIGAALGLLPLTGVPLPLVSLGGTSLLVVLAGLGILLNIATNRRSHIVVSTQRGDRAARGGGDRRAPAAGARRRG